jgi:hypothetical protein
MDKAESSSTIDSLEGKMNTIRDEEKLDIVTALTTPLQQTVIKKHAENLKKLKSLSANLFCALISALIKKFNKSALKQH